MMKLLQLFCLVITFTNLVRADGIIDAEYKWNQKSIKVCWGTATDLPKSKAKFARLLQKVNPEYHSQQTKNLIQSKIQEQFTIKNTGVEFTGWKTCTAIDNSDVVLVAIKDFTKLKTYLNLLKAGTKGAASLDVTTGMASLGTSHEEYWRRRRADEKGFVYITDRISDNRKQNLGILTTALHEFGHLAGLEHEHNRSGILQDKNCQKMFEGKIKEQIFKTDRMAYTYYDSQSIMNYCHLYYLQKIKKSTTTKDIRLSDLDIHTLRCTYLPDQETECKKFKW